MLNIAGGRGTTVGDHTRPVPPGYAVKKTSVPTLCSAGTAAQHLAFFDPGPARSRPQRAPLTVSRAAARVHARDGYGRFAARRVPAPPYGTRPFVCSSLHRELTFGERFDSQADISLD